MELNLSLPRLSLFAACLVGFWLWGGFAVPVLAADAFQDPVRVQKAWLYCVLFFVGGAGGASVIDHHVGTLDRSNLRFFYIVMGVALMFGGCIWLRGLREASGPGPTEQVMSP